MMSMHRLAIALTALGLLAFAPGCEKATSVYQACFYTIEDTANAELFLFINDVPEGKLPYIRQRELACDDAAAAATLKLPMNTGKYKLSVKDGNGVTLVQHDITLKSRTYRTRGSLGNVFTHLRGNCLTVNLVPGR